MLIFDLVFTSERLLHYFFYIYTTDFQGEKNMVLLIVVYNM